MREGRVEGEDDLDFIGLESLWKDPSLGKTIKNMHTKLGTGP